MVKIVVHHKYGMRAMPNKTEKLGRNQVLGGLSHKRRVNTLETGHKMNQTYTDAVCAGMVLS